MRSSLSDLIDGDRHHDGHEFDEHDDDVDTLATWGRPRRAGEVLGSVMARRGARRDDQVVLDGRTTPSTSSASPAIF
jgi:hypothetical protein